MRQKQIDTDQNVSDSLGTIELNFGRSRLNRMWLDVRNQTNLRQMCEKKPIVLFLV